MASRQRGIPEEAHVVSILKWADQTILGMSEYNGGSATTWVSCLAVANWAAHEKAFANLVLVILFYQYHVCSGGVSESFLPVYSLQTSPVFALHCHRCSYLYEMK